ncbi:DUF5131 family protein [Nitrospinota bacterium]
MKTSSSPQAAGRSPRPAKTGRTTGIEWTHHTWNPFVGCSPKSPGCWNCYAEDWSGNMQRMGKSTAYQGVIKMVNGRPRWTGAVNLATPATLAKIDRIKAATPLIFVNSMSDFWHENAKDEWRSLVFQKIRNRSDLIFQILTKRPENIGPMLGRMGETVPDNVWLGATVEDHRVLERIDILRSVPAKTRFISVEPMIAPFTGPQADGRSFGPALLERISGHIHQIIGGGESGSRARSCEPHWAIELRDLCLEAGVPFFWKQWGKPANNPVYRVALEKTGSRKATLAYLKREDPEGKGGSLIEGKAWKEFPVCYTGPSPAAALPVYAP